MSVTVKSTTSHRVVELFDDFRHGRADISIGGGNPLASVVISTNTDEFIKAIETEFGGTFVKDTEPLASRERELPNGAVAETAESARRLAAHYAARAKELDKKQVDALTDILRHIRIDTVKSIAEAIIKSGKVTVTQ